VPDYDVMAHPRGGWQVRRDGATRASSRHATLAEAHAVATRHAYRSGGVVRVEGAASPAAPVAGEPASRIDAAEPQFADVQRAPKRSAGADQATSSARRSGGVTRRTHVAVGLVLLGGLVTGAARRGKRRRG
jgi:hypothetical protein